MHCKAPVVWADCQRIFLEFERRTFRIYLKCEYEIPWSMRNTIIYED